MDDIVGGRLYSARRESTGFACAALRAGIVRNSSPMPADAAAAQPTTLPSGTACQPCRYMDTGHTQQYAHDTPGNAQHHRFQQKLQQHIRAPCPQGAAQPDLLHPFPHGHQHDRQYPHPSHRQGQRGDADRQVPEGNLSLPLRAHQLQLVLNGEVVRPVQPQAGTSALEEGKIDLLFEENDGWVMVDYKTDQIGLLSTEVARELRSRHSGQVKEYAAALTTLGVRVRAAHLLLARTGASVDIPLN